MKSKIFVLFITLFFIGFQLSAQSLPDSITQKIDALFAKWNHNNTPGCEVGIVRNDSLMFSKAYGMANLEYNIPLTIETPICLASITKQFTAYCIVLLAKQGKLNFDDDIRKYLTWFPDYGKKITIANLLNHTSGIRDHTDLDVISGVNDYGFATQDFANRILQKQTRLNFEPGTEFSYSNSNYELLAEIIKAISGKNPNAFADSAVFKPLRMKNSFFRDDYRSVIKNKAESYTYDNDVIQYVDAHNTMGTSGSGGVYSTINDMAKWMENFYAPKADDANNIEVLTEKPTLSDGTVSAYAKGIYVDTYKGWRQFSHDGETAGYRTIMAVFPDLKLGFAVFGNNGDDETYATIDKLKDLFIIDTSKHLQATPIDDSTITDLSFIKKFTGNYVSDDASLLSVFIKDNKLYAHTDDGDQLLKRDPDNNYHPEYASYITLHFSLNSTTHDTSFTTTDASEIYHFIKYTPQTLTQAELKAYTGTYYCPELETAYNISLKDSSLFITDIKYIDMPLTVVNKNHLISHFYGLNLLEFTRDKTNNITGFEANSARIKHLRFDKIN